MGTDKEYLTAAETARLVRKALAKSFPGTKFYVRSDTFAGGASVDVFYDGATIDPTTGFALQVDVDFDGNPTGYPLAEDFPMRGRSGHLPKPGTPPRRDVEKVVNGFSGKNFDGMIDYGYTNDVYLDADDMPVGGSSRGSEETHGMHPAYDIGRDKAVRVVHTGVWTHVSDEEPYDVRVKKEVA